MARLASCLLLILAIPLVAGIADPQGDATQRVGGEPVDEPAIDLRNVTATLNEGLFSLRIETWGDLMIGDQAPAQAPDREYTYLFIVALGVASDTNLYNHVSAGGDSITVICTYHEGAFDLSCKVTAGDAVLRATGAAGRNVTARFAADFQGSYAIGASSHVSIPNGTGREILAQDFTSNALPYQGLPGGPQVGEAGDDGAAASKGPWWTSAWAIAIAIGAAIFVIGMVVPWEWFRPSHWKKRP